MDGFLLGHLRPNVYKYAHVEKCGKFLAIFKKK